MNKNTHIAIATRMLGKLLKAQPNLLRPTPTTESSGEELANFMAAFIRRYSESLKAMDQGASPE